jgi:hypothetical protein
MPEISRRAFVTKGSVSAAAVGALAVTGVALSAPADAASPAAEPDAPVVAHIRNLRAGQVDVYIGTREVTVVDHELANRLARAAARA